MIVIPVNSWSDYKSSIIGDKGLKFQYADKPNYYELYANEAMFMWTISLLKGTADSADFEINYKSTGNQPIDEEVTTQYEKNDKDLKLAKLGADVNGTTGIAEMAIQVPGTPGSKDGRYVAGGYATSSDFDKDDYLTVHIEDRDRMVAWSVALAQDPGATAPATDADVQALGEFPNYPIVKSYTDDELPAANQGWYFWPIANTSGSAPFGECEVEPIGGYGFLPAGMYMVLRFVRPNSTTGWVRIDLYWGKKE